MKSFGSYISKYLVSFVAFILILLFLNAVVFGLTFQKIVTEDYGDSSPQAMLEMTANDLMQNNLSLSIFNGMSVDKVKNELEKIYIAGLHDKIL